MSPANPANPIVDQIASAGMIGKATRPKQRFIDQVLMQRQSAPDPQVNAGVAPGMNELLAGLMSQGGEK